MREIGERDTQVQLLRAATRALGPIYKAQKWLLTRGDLDYTGAVSPWPRWAQIEVIGRRLLADREVIPQAMTLNPAFFKIVYADLLNGKKTRKNVHAGSRRSTAIWPSRAATLFAPVIDHLREVREAMVML